MVTIQTGNQIFEDMLGNINYSKDSSAGELYPFKVRVGCVKRRPPRHQFFDYIRDMGMFDIDKVFNKNKFDKEILTFVFPERWMGVAEQQSFMHHLQQHPQATKIKQVDIITSSPLLIGSFRAEQIRILTWKDDDIFI